jgi:hypothetical protein
MVRMLLYGADSGMLTISVAPAFAESWLVPRLGRFRARHPAIDLRIIATMQLADFELDGIDLGIRHGLGRYPGLHSERIIEGNGVRVVIIEDASRFARKLLTQELGIIALAERGVSVVTASGDDLTNTDDEMKVAMRQIAGAFAQLEKSRLMRKLREARERKRAETGKCEGRMSYAEARPEVVALVRELHGQRQSLRQIAKTLASQGHLTGGGKPYTATAVQKMLRGG